jgi:hypothetical protein
MYDVSTESLSLSSPLASFSAVRCDCYYPETTRKFRWISSRLADGCMVDVTDSTIRVAMADDLEPGQSFSFL